MNKPAAMTRNPRNSRHDEDYSIRIGCHANIAAVRPTISAHVIRHRAMRFEYWESSARNRTSRPAFRCNGPPRSPPFREPQASRVTEASSATPPFLRLRIGSPTGLPNGATKWAECDGIAITKNA